jgi:cytochrome P450
MEKIDKKTKNFYTIEDLICDFKNFFAASTDTTANTTTILTYLLAKHKDV